MEPIEQHNKTHLQINYPKNIYHLIQPTLTTMYSDYSEYFTKILWHISMVHYDSDNVPQYSEDFTKTLWHMSMVHYGSEDLGN